MIAREGSNLVISSVGASLLVSLLLSWQIAVASWCFVAVMAYLFRDTRHRVPPAPLGVVSPVTGMVVQIGPIEDLWLERQAVRIRIRIASVGPFALFSPTEGKIVRQWMGHCTGANAAGQESLCQTVWIKTDEDDDISMVILPKLQPARSKCRINTGERIGQGQRCGFVFAGGFVDVLVPASTRIDVERGQALEAGADVIATLVHGASVHRDPLAMPQGSSA